MGRAMYPEFNERKDEGMSECQMCKQHIGLFKPKWTKLDGMKFCKECAPKWQVERKERVMAALFAESEPKPNFCMTGITASEPDCPTRWFHTGNLLFTDKGVCFVGLVTWKMHRGLRALEAFSQMNEALATGDEMNRDFPSTSLKDFLGRSERLIFIPKAEIKQMKYRPIRCLKIRTEKKSYIFTLRGGKKEYEATEPYFKQYMGC